MSKIIKIARLVLKTWLKLCEIIVSTLQMENFNDYNQWLLFNSAIFQLYHGENKLTFNKMMMSALY